MTQVNTPYPATAYLTGFLRSRGHDVVQADPAIDLLLRLLSPKGLKAAAGELARKGKRPSSISVRHFLAHAEEYAEKVGPVVRFLQGGDPTLAHRIASDGYLPRGPRFETISQMEENGLEWAFGSLGLRDRAQHLASLFVDDLIDALRDGVDSRFELSRYGEKLAASAPSFDPILKALQARPTLVDRMLDELTDEILDRVKPTVVGLTVPFPGNVYGAFRIAARIKQRLPEAKIVMGGGYVNTELRELSDPRVFDLIDFITLDDGEAPMLALLDHLSGKSPGRLLRTLVRKSGRVRLESDPTLHDIPFRDAGTPTYDGLPLEKYLSLCELLNPMHRLWSDGRWNKLTLAHGCYWKKCTFCDVSLDYIGRYEPESADRIVDKMVHLIEETGQTGFHFVDEAAPPKLLGALADRLIARGVTATWWANIRFEKTFTPELAHKLAASGCVAVSGGLEVASDRLLALMKKGVTVEQVARVTHAFTSAGVMVHAYLMYGFPTQTLQETIDSLERVRQLFAAGCIQSAFWHRFACTLHSPVGKDPDAYGIRLLDVPSTFARNEIPFEDPTGVDHDSLHPGLRKALYNYMHGLGVDEDVRAWFEFPVPRAKVARTLVARALRTAMSESGQSFPH